jgi:phosphatidylcholine synthase
VLPSIDGALLDNVVDYLTYVVVPAVLVRESGLLPAGLDIAAACGICGVSAVQFAHIEAKTEDGLFRGFPSCWNVIALYLLLLRPSASWTVTLLAGLGVLALAPFYCVYPNRTPLLRRTTLALTAGWILTLVAIVARYPEPAPWVVALSLAYLAYYAGLSLVLTLRRRLSRESA